MTTRIHTEFGQPVFRTYRRGDEHRIVALYNNLFPEPIDLDVWQWLWRKAPAGEAHVELAVINGQIASHFSFFPTYMKFGDQVRRASKSFCAMTHPNFRGQGLFSQVTRNMLEAAAQLEFPITYSNPNSASYGLLVERIGYRNFFGDCGLPIFVFPVKLSSLLDKYVGGISSTHRIGELALRLFRVFFRPRCEAMGSGAYIVEVDDFDEEFDALWEEVRNQYVISTVRDRRYLSWRYTAVPSRDYTVLAGKRNGKLRGYVAFRARNMFDLRLGMIVDILVSPGERAIGEALIAKAVNRLVERGVDAVGCLMLSHHCYASWLKAQGFVLFPSLMRPRDFNYVVHINTSQVSRALLENPRNWYLTWGDAEDG